MSPKRAQELPDGGAISKPKRSRPGVPLTTADKIAAIEATKSKAMAAEKKASKPRILPPPGEAFCVPKSKPIWKVGKSRVPLTTKGKIRAAAAKKKKDESLKKQQQAVKSADEKARVSKSRGGTPGMSIYSAVMNSGKSTLQYTSKNSVAAKVTERPTERTKMLQGHRSQAEQIQTQIDRATGSAAAVTMAATSKLRIIDLAADVRHQIWILCVVYPNFFIWPDSPTGKEQPDLAMTCRSIRAEVLPIFYGRNIFAIDVSPTPSEVMTAKSARGRRLTSLEVVQQWSRCLEKKSWFSMIRKWSFSYTPMERFPETKNSPGEGNYIVSVKFVDRQRQPGRRAWDATVEVHRDARCILPSAAQYGQCIIQTTPKWLQRAVIDVIGAADGGAIRGDAIIELVKKIQIQAKDLNHFECEKVLSSIEVGQRGFVVE